MSEWEAYDRLEPIGEQRADFRMGILASTIMNLAGSIWGKKGSYKAVSPVDFIPKWDGEEGENVQVQSTEDMKNILLGFVSSHNKKVKK